MRTFCSGRIPYSICLVKVQICCIPHPLQSILSKYVRHELCGHFRRTISKTLVAELVFYFFINKKNADLSLWLIRMKLHIRGKPVSVDSLTPAM